jgi:hypothetical protein
MGDVFLGRSRGGRPVAVKVIRADLAADPGFRARFAREVSAARRVSALYTAPVVDADPDGDLPWLVTAYVPGPSLADAVTDHGPLRAGVVRALAAGLAEGLAAIHAAGVVHRDLKPSNVLLASDGPRIIDFGISRAVEASALTLTGMFAGTPAFMSPEQASGASVGPPSDVFSLGSVLTFAATGHGPFPGDTVPALFYQVVSGEPELGDAPAELRPLIACCLNKDPRQRPTPEQVITELGPPGLMHDWLPPAITATLARYDPPSARQQAPAPPEPPPQAASAASTVPRPAPSSPLPARHAPPPAIRPYQPYRPVPWAAAGAAPYPAGPPVPRLLPREYRFGLQAVPWLLLAGAAAYIVPIETYWVFIIGFFGTVAASRVTGLVLRVRRHGTTGLAGLAARCVLTDLASMAGLALLAFAAIAASVYLLLPAIGPAGSAAAYRAALSTSGPANPFATAEQAAYFLHLYLPLAVLLITATVLLRTRADLRRPLALPRAARLLSTQPASARIAAAAAPVALAAVLIALNGGLSPARLPAGAICTIGHYTCEAAARLHFR